MIFTKFSEKLKVVSSDFSIMKSSVVSSSSILQIKLTCCFKQGFSDSFACSDLLQLVCNVLKSIHCCLQCCIQCCYTLLYSHYFCSSQQFFLVCFFFVLYCNIKKAFYINYYIVVFHFNSRCIIL